LAAGWAAGATLFLLPVVIGLWQIRLLPRSGLPWRHGQSVVDALALDLGIHRCVEVLLHEGLPGPMTSGVVHPVIVLPRDAEDWNPDDLNRALVHELEHVRRGDWVTRCLASVACALYWFHPLVWIVWRKLDLEAERSCDDAVLGHSEGTAYADQLVGLAKRMTMARRSPRLAMANRADLAARVGAVLDSRQRRGRAGTFSLAVAAAGAVVLVVVLSSITLVAAPQETQPRLPELRCRFDKAIKSGREIFFTTVPEWQTCRGRGPP
jgi:beta-lactamase regulating signal transducer with metallopeptidase domain